MVHYWTGAVSSDPTVAGNWDPSGPPGNGDDAVVAPDAITGNNDIGGGSLAVDSWLVASGYEGNIGTSSSRLDFTSPSGSINYFGRGTFYHAGGFGSFGTNINASGIEGGFDTNGTAGNIYLTRGRLTKANRSIGAVFVSHRGNYYNDSIYTNTHSLGTLTVYQGAGKSTLNISSTAELQILIGGGSMKINGSGGNISLECYSGTVNVVESTDFTRMWVFGGTVYCKASAVPDGAIVFPGGTLNITDADDVDISGIDFANIKGTIVAGGTKIAPTDYHG